MIYVMSDIHGCYDQYKSMLKKIQLTDVDTLYVVGDAIDWGPQPMEVLWDMSVRTNVIPIMGNHEYAAYEILRQLSSVEITENGIKNKPGSDIDIDTFILEMQDWINIGGKTTIDGFNNLQDDEKAFYLEYLEEFSLYEVVEVNGKEYVLTHSGLPDGATEHNLDSFDAYDFAMASVDHKSKCFDNVIFVTGYNPTKNLGEGHIGKIYRKNNHIGLDTGAVIGEKLGCLCLNTDEEFYT